MLKEELHDALPWGPTNTYLFASLTAETVATLFLAPFQTCEVGPPRLLLLACCCGALVRA
jgi:hypothetical protein